MERSVIRGQWIRYSWITLRSIQATSLEMVDNAAYNLYRKEVLRFLYERQHKSAA